MKEVAPGAFQLKGFPPNAINVWLMGDVLVDAATKLAGNRILEASRAAPSPLTRCPAIRSGTSPTGASPTAC